MTILPMTTSQPGVKTTMMPSLSTTATAWPTPQRATHVNVQMTMAPTATMSPDPRNAAQVAAGRHAPVNRNVRHELTEELFVDGVKRARPYMHRVAVEIVGLPDADDVVSESILRAWRGRHTYNGTASVSTWLGACARNTAVMHLRATRARPRRPVNYTEEQFGLDWLADKEAPAHEKIYAGQVRKAVQSAIASLPLGTQRCFADWLAGRTMPTSTTKVRVYRATPKVIARVRVALGIRATDNA